MKSDEETVKWCVNAGQFALPDAPFGAGDDPAFSGFVTGI
jgi:hypothetical protein